MKSKQGFPDEIPGCVAPIANVVPLLRNGSVHTSDAVVCELSHRVTQPAQSRN